MPDSKAILDFVATAGVVGSIVNAFIPHSVRDRRPNERTISYLAKTRWRGLVVAACMVFVVSRLSLFETRPLIPADDHRFLSVQTLGHERIGVEHRYSVALHSDADHFAFEVQGQVLGVSRDRLARSIQTQYTLDAAPPLVPIYILVSERTHKRVASSWWVQPLAYLNIETGLYQARVFLGSSRPPDVARDGYLYEIKAYIPKDFTKSLTKPAYASLSELPGFELRSSSLKIMTMRSAEWEEKYREQLRKDSERGPQPR